MSVIAFDGRIVCAETYMGTHSSGRGGLYRKIMAVKPYTKPAKVRKLIPGPAIVFGAVGAATYLEPLVRWYLSGMEDKAPGDDDTVLSVFQLGKPVISIVSGMAGYTMHHAPYATGAGECHAAAVMHLGKTAEEAVQVACDLVPSCKPPIEVFDLQTETWVRTTGTQMPNHDILKPLMDHIKWRIL